MKLEYLDNIGIDESIIRLFNFDKLQAHELKNAIIKNLVNEGIELNINKLSFISAVNCQLILRLSINDIGITTGDKEEFVCDLTIDSYKQMLQLMEPFCEREYEHQCYQWLYDLDNEIEFLLSPSGQW